MARSPTEVTDRNRGPAGAPGRRPTSTEDRFKQLNHLLGVEAVIRRVHINDELSAGEMGFVVCSELPRFGLGSTKLTNASLTAFSRIRAPNEWPTTTTLLFGLSCFAAEIIL